MTTVTIKDLQATPQRTIKDLQAILKVWIVWMQCSISQYEIKNIKNYKKITKLYELTVCGAPGPTGVGV